MERHAPFCRCRLVPQLNASNPPNKHACCGLSHRKRAALPALLTPPAPPQADISLSLVKLAQLLAAFPLPLGSAEAELLAGSIQQQTSLEFRKVRRLAGRARPACRAGGAP